MFGLCKNVILGLLVLWWEEYSENTLNLFFIESKPFGYFEGVDGFELSSCIMKLGLVLDNWAVVSSFLGWNLPFKWS